MLSGFQFWEIVTQFLPTYNIPRCKRLQRRIIREEKTVAKAMAIFLRFRIFRLKEGKQDSSISPLRDSGMMQFPGQLFPKPDIGAGNP